MTRQHDLTGEAHRLLKAAFKEYNHNPSDDQLKALYAIQETLTAMAEGKAGRKYYLSSLDPGIGKTTAIVTWIRAYRQLHGGDCPTGLMICVDRLSEIQRYVTDCQLPEDSFAVLAGKRETELNALGLGSENINKALILFTTKEQIRRRSQGISIDDQSVFYFNDKPRGIKVWDESLMIGKDIVIDPYEFGRLFAPLAKVSEELVAAVQQIIDKIRGCESGAFYIIPELPELPRDFFESSRWKRNNDRELLELLWRISGQSVTIRKYKGTQLIVDCVQSIPSDFPPCIILDASGRIKETSRIQQRKLKNLVRLPYSNKSYRNLTVKVWNRAAGKGIIKDLKAVTPELVKIIKSRQGEEFLFLLYQDHVEDLQTSLSKHLTTSDRKRLNYCTHGKHTATNEFCNIPNIIAMSAYQYPDPQYEAITRASGMMTSDKGVFPTQEEISMVKKGEISSDFLQGVTRGLPRKSEGDTCPPSRLWLIAHPNTGLRKELPVIFPECSVEDWKTQEFTLTKKQQKVFDLINEQIKKGLTVFPSAPIRKALGIRQDSFKRMMDHKALKVALSSIKTSIISQAEGWFFQVLN